MKTIDERLYDYYIANPPSRSTAGLDARPFQNSFWVGYDGGPMMGQPNSNARLAWQAGRDTAKAKEEQKVAQG